MLGIKVLLGAAGMVAAIVPIIYVLIKGCWRKEM